MEPLFFERPYRPREPRWPRLRYFVNQPGAGQVTQDATAKAMGLLGMTYNPTASGALTGLTNGTGYFAAVQLPFGRKVTNVLLSTGLAGTGTAPTSCQLGLATPAGKIVALTGNVGTTTFFTANASKAAPLGTPYTPNTTDSPNGVYAAILLMIGSFGTQQPTILRGNATQVPFAPNLNFIGEFGTGIVAALTVGQTLTFNAAGGLGWWVGFD